MRALLYGTRPEPWLPPPGVGPLARNLAETRDMASLHALRGEPDLAIARLERVVAQLPAITRVRVAADPDLASLRELEAFSKLTANSQG